MHVDRLTSDPGDATLAYRRAVVHPKPPPSDGVPTKPAGDLPASGEAHQTAETGHDRPSAPPMLGLSVGDRAAVASVTGYYLSPTGDVMPDGNPPWSFIIQYVAHRKAERAELNGAGGAAQADAVGDTNLDITV